MTTYNEMGLTLDALLRDGWSVEMETGIRGGEVRSWVTLRHWNRGLKIKRRAQPFGLATVLAMASVDALSSAPKQQARDGEKQC